MSLKEKIKKKFQKIKKRDENIRASLEGLIDMTEKVIPDKKKYTRKQKYKEHYE